MHEESGLDAYTPDDEKGFKDDGLEGQLREAIHKVERSGYPFDKADMLTLRRHEKDFFLRHDLKYQQQHDETKQQMIAQDFGGDKKSEYPIA